MSYRIPFVTKAPPQPRLADLNVGQAFVFLRPSFQPSVCRGDQPADVFMTITSSDSADVRLVALDGDLVGHTWTVSRRGETGRERVVPLRLTGAEEVTL